MSDSDRPAGASSTGLVRDALREGRSERSVLMIAFHFPPVQGSSGWQRCLRFAQHLPRYGWRPVILTVHARAYEARSAESIAGVPEGLEVHRAFGLDTARHLSLWGRYPRFLAQPDRWATWKYLAVPTALRLIRRLRIDLLWSTFPIATAHQIGLEVARKSGVPWIAEFRDPMWQGDYPPDPVINSAWKQLEQQVFQQAAATVVTTPGARQLYERRFTAAIGCPPPVLIENGYDEGTFRAAEARLAATPAGAGGTERPVVLLHSGIVYRSERDPSQLFKAVAALRQAGRISAARLQIVFRACGDEAGYRRDLEALGIADIIRLQPAVAYEKALREMLSVDALLLLQASNCNEQIPAKLYEYLRAGRPILALTDPAGDTARTLQAAGCGIIARLDSAADIERALLQLLDELHADRWKRSNSDFLLACSRQVQAGRLAQLLDEAVTGGSVASLMGGR